MMSYYHEKLINEMSLLTKILFVYLFSKTFNRDKVTFSSITFYQFLCTINIKKVSEIQIKNSFEECKNLLQGFA